MLENDEMLGSFNIDADQLKIEDEDDNKFKDHTLGEQHEIKTVLKTALQKKMIKI